MEATLIKEKLVPLVMNCPTGCGNRRIIKHWVRTGCKGQIFLKGNGNLLCLDQCLEKSMCEWKFACENHQGDYRKVDFNHLIDALGCALLSTKAFFKNDKESLLFLASLHSHICGSMEALL